VTPPGTQVATVLRYLVGDPTCIHTHCTLKGTVCLDQGNAMDGAGWSKQEAQVGNLESHSFAHTKQRASIGLRGQGRGSLPSEKLMRGHDDDDDLSLHVGSNWHAHTFSCIAGSKLKPRNRCAFMALPGWGGRVLIHCKTWRGEDTNKDNVTT
jgi:hypothetical protein